MANSNLTSAKKAKNDEFYTQFSDIQKEIEAYLEYDKNVFRGKVVYCNCDDPFESNFFRYFVLNFKRLGLRRLIATSYKPSPIANTELMLQPSLFEEYEDKIIREPAKQKGRDKTTANKFIISDVGDINGDGAFTLADIAEQLKANNHNEWQPLKGDGDFRSEECIELLQQSDIVVTNPPFSLFREYVAQLVEYKKQFAILSNKGATIYKEIFPLIQENRVWAGTMSFSNDILFIAPKDADLSDKPRTAIRVLDGITYLRSPSIWLTNIDHGRRHQPLNLMTMADNRKFNKKVIKSDTAYRQYDNYNAIEVPFTDAIPSDYDGIMGVPISFLDKYSPEQFEIIWQASGNSYANMPPEQLRRVGFIPNVPGAEGAGQGVGVINGKKVYSRLLIKHRRENI